MADEPDWAKVLRFMYNNEGTYTVEADSKNGEVLGRDDHYDEMKRKLLSQLDLQANEIDEVKEVIQHLGRLNLINLGKRSDYAELMLEPDGFEVAHERELTKQQHRTNDALVILTFGLVLATIVTNIPSYVVQILGGILVMIFLGAAIYYTDLFDLSSL